MGQRGELFHPRAELRLGEHAVLRHGVAPQRARERAVAEVVVVAEARQAAKVAEVDVVHSLLLCRCLRFFGRSQGGVPHCARERCLAARVPNWRTAQKSKYG